MLKVRVKIRHGGRCDLADVYLAQGWRPHPEERERFDELVRRVVDEFTWEEPSYFPRGIDGIEIEEIIGPRRSGMVALHSTCSYGAQGPVQAKRV